MRRDPPSPGAGPERAPGRLFLLLAALLAVLLAAVVFRPRSRSTPGPSPNATNTGAALEEAVVRAFAAIESIEGQATETFLAPEIQAEAFGARIEALWDALNAAPDALATLRDVTVRTFAEPGFGPVESLRHGLHRARSTGTPGPGQPWTTAVARLEEARRAGWRLEHSEWRHVAFAPASGADPARSRYEVRLLLTRDPSPARLQIRARVRFDWPTASATNPGDLKAGLGDVVVEEAEWIAREGPAPFVTADTRELQPLPRTTWIDPVIVHDLDGDGRPEVLLVARNRVLRRTPDGTWSEEELTPYHPGLLFTALLADFDGDARPDLLCAVRSGLVLLKGGATGAFDTPAVPVWTAPTRLQYAQAFTCGDFDHDGDLDVFLGQYRTPYEGGQMPRPYFDALDGPPAYLLRNDGDGRFTDVTMDSGLATKRHRRSYGASFVDLDRDGDLDLWVTSDFAGADVWLNDGHGHFTDATATRLDDPRAFGMSHTFSDFDADGRLDALLVGMPQTTADRLESMGIERPGFEAWRNERRRLTFGNRLYFGDEAGHRQRPVGRDLARAGWAWSAAAADLDHDRLPDLFVVNGHETRQSVRDYEREFWTHDIYVGDSTPRPAVEAYFSAKFTTSRARGWSYGGHDQNRLYLNDGTNGFVEAGHALGLALAADSRNAVAEDFDGDGAVDLLVTTFEIWPQLRQTVRIYENRLGSSGNWIAFRLRSVPGGVPNVGVEATLHDARGAQTRVWLTGDGYRSQSQPLLRFGLGDVARVDHVEFRWPGSRALRVEAPSIHRVHDVTSPAR